MTILWRFKMISTKSVVKSNFRFIILTYFVKFRFKLNPADNVLFSFCCVCN